jgi:hypothetical protein
MVAPGTFPERHATDAHDPLYIVDVLPNSLECIGLRGDVEQARIGSFPIDCRAGVAVVTRRQGEG